MKAAQAIRRRGTPLAVLAILLAGWVFLRIATWETPLAFPALAVSPDYQTQNAGLVEGTASPARPRFEPAPHSVAYPHLNGYPPHPAAYGYMHYPYTSNHPQGGNMPQLVFVTPSGRLLPASANGYAPFAGKGAIYPGPQPQMARRRPYPLAPHLGQGRALASSAMLGTDWRLQPGDSQGLASRKREGKRYPASQGGRPPFAAQPSQSNQPFKDRWLLDAYGFYRQGSSALSVTQGRQPIYGASQIAANLQWRARPSSSHDPRVYARAYHALVTGGESELAGGVSARPVGSIPVRLYGELRAVRNPALTSEGVSTRTDLRPAAYAVTEFPPQKLPLGFSLEAYGAGGYVGGDASTYFLDGQAAVTRPVTRISKTGVGSAAVSLGAGVWGGAQEGVSRVDVGPTLRFDVDIGKLPARVSVDYREQVAGDAEPDSGVAATVSTRF